MNPSDFLRIVTSDGLRVHLKSAKNIPATMETCIRGELILVPDETFEVQGSDQSSLRLANLYFFDVAYRKCDVQKSETLSLNISEGQLVANIDLLKFEKSGFINGPGSPELILTEGEIQKLSNFCKSLVRLLKDQCSV